MSFSDGQVSAGGIIPPPLLVVIEDVGWWCGISRPEKGEPFRTGMPRNHVPEDYEALVRLARKLGTQVVAGMVLCEWDREGFLSGIPSSTWLGKNWKESREGMDFQERSVAILNENTGWVCAAVHGVGHEFWIDGNPDRTEFHDASGVMRDRGVVAEHLRAFFRLFETTGLKLDIPRIFIPPALKHSFGNVADGFQKILSDFGIRFVLTVFEKARQHRPPLFPSVTEECGVVLVERGTAPVSWDDVSALPRFSFNHPVIPLHWANILNEDPQKNDEVVDRWVGCLKNGAGEHGFVFLSDALSSLVQIVVHQLSEIQKRPDGTVIDIRNVKKVMPVFLLEKGFYASLGPHETIHEKDGRIEPAGHVRKDLVKILPFESAETLRIVTRS
jgi:hypothetical protein